MGNYVENFDELIVGESAGPVTITTSEEARLAALALATQARRSLHIFSRDLDAPLFDNVPFVDAVAGVAARSRNTFVHILLQDANRVVNQGHRLLELGYRLDSKIKMRKPHPDYQHFNEAFLIADETGLIHRRPGDRYDGIVDFSARREARELVKFFSDVWERSAPDPGLRRLHL